MGDRGFDPYYEWLGIQPAEQPADFYRLLGIARFEGNPTVIERAADRQMGYVRQFQAKFPTEVSELLSQLSLARITLTNGEKKLLYDSSLRPGAQRSRQVQRRQEVPRTATEAPGRAWYVQLSGIPQGPLTTDELQARIKAKEVRGDTLIRNGSGGRWMLAREARGLFDLRVSSPPAPGTGLPNITPLEPVAEGVDLLSGPLPEPEDRTPGPNVWVCPGCRWPVPRSKTNCPRCAYVKKVNESQGTEQRTMLVLFLIAAAIIIFVLCGAING
jgi:predicted nucleic acid-binding Zn ribbon protein